MDVVQAVQDYVTKMVESVAGMKVLIMDKETAGIVSMVYSQSAVLQKEVYLFERLDSENRELMAHLRAVCFLRPTADNCQLLDKELRKPKYGEYHIFFSNTIKNNYLEELAEADEHEVVQQVQEFYGDYYAVNTDLFTLNIDSYFSVDNDAKAAALDRTYDGLMSLLLSLKKAPIIRYQRNSEVGTKIAQELTRRMQQEKSLFDFRRPDVAPILLIVDRRNDPVTPLLLQWTYQAMVHELLTINNNRVDLRDVPGIKKDLQQVVLSGDQDPFYKANMFKNFGDLGVAIKMLVDEFQVKTKSNQNIQSIADMKRFVEEYPEFRKMSGNVSKHVAVMSELSRLVDVRNLLDISELEQELACKQDRSAALKKIRKIMERREIAKEDVLRLVMLFALRYEESSQEVGSLIDALFQLGFDEEAVGRVSSLITYAGASKRQGDLFENANLLRIARSSMMRGLKGVNNIYTEHVPALKNILMNLVAGNLKENEYPCPTAIPREKPQDILVFVVGGATYEEAACVRSLNENPQFGARVVLGASTLHNSHTFINELARVKEVVESSYSGKRRV
eukprot:TRINITY_DN13278_c0_g1_i1.p1 TRINITY_DN13278_c0_g1~~TRINITY_DN13278_c0_g1_i1.p1  ORF type:complete len:564 (+),score=111.57 TRINITY_DN13278_c0_g1_i1:78-1769(+)